LSKLEEDEGWGETDDALTGASKEPQKQSSSLPHVSLPDLTPLEQKRSLRVEMLSRMIGMTFEMRAKLERNATYTVPVLPK